MTPGEQADQEAVLVRAVAGNVADVMEGEWDGRAWLHLFVDFEIDARGERMSAICFSLARRKGEAVEKIAFRLPASAKQAFAAIADGMERRDGRRWNAARLRIERDGRHAIDYDHEAPVRLGGALNDRRYLDYLGRWLESEAGAPYRPASPAGRRRWFGGKGR